MKRKKTMSYVNLDYYYAGDCDRFGPILGSESAEQLLEQYNADGADYEGFEPAELENIQAALEYIRQDRLSSAREMSEQCAHDWQEPWPLVGGLKESPGIWAIGGTAMRSVHVCRECGAWLRVRWDDYHLPRPWRQETIEPPTTESMAWVVEMDLDNGYGRALKQKMGIR